jgi:hypothetical protein
MYIQCLCYATYFSLTGYLQATHFLRTLMHCAPGQIVLIRYVIVVIINFDVVGCFSPYIFYYSRFSAMYDKKLARTIYT